jgi:uncharacterized damage-inducible protein DinB
MTTTPDLPHLALDDPPGRPFPAVAASHLRESLDKIRLATAGLDEDDLWFRPAPGTNSIGNLMLHLVGNLSLWLLAGVGGREFHRDRAGEFAADRTAGRDELLARLTATVGEATALLDSLDDEATRRRVHIQRYDTDVLTAIFHATEHMSYHTGQIVWIAKQALARRGERIEFYPRHAKE